MKQLEQQGMRAALRLGRRHIRVNLQGSKQATYMWSDYSMSRDIERPVQRRPKVDHFSVPKADR